MTIERLIEELEKFKDQVPEDTEVFICDLSDDSDEKFHFRAIDDTEIIRIRRQQRAVLYFNKES